jgi:serine/threonine protein kinase/tetratricopeptide (TPR) repeat protein
MPDQIGRYRIVSRIGRGAMGVVYSAVDEMTERPVALKVLIADLESDPETRARFYREAQAAARLLHPNVITVYDAGDDLGRSFIAMQLLDGAPLPVYLKRPEAESLDRKLDLMIQVCEGLAAAHAEGIIHRDLKPNNLFVQSDGLLKILDFGVARLTDSSMTAAGTILGTPDYMSPEQARSTQVDVRSDIFSAGAVFYFMLAGRKPFPGPDLPAILRQLQFEEPAPLRGVPPELVTIVTQAMAKNPDHRPGRVEQLLADLVRFRRQFQTDTRRMAYNLRTEFEDLLTLRGSLDQVGQDLGLPGETVDPLATLRRDHPFLTLGTTEPIPSDRSILNGLALMLQGHRESLAAVLEARYASLALLQQGEAALASGDARGACTAFEAVLAQCHGGRAVDLLATARALDRTHDERLAQAAERLAEARRALQVGDVVGAQVRCREARSLDIRDANLATSIAEVEQAANAEQRRVTQLVQQALDRAAAAIEVQAFDQAQAALDEAAIWQPDSPTIAAARHRLAQERAAVEAAEQLRAVSVDAIRRARSAFRRGRYEEAIRQLDSFVALEPAADLVAEEVEHLRRLQTAISQSATSVEAIVQSSIAAATAARDRQAFDVAHQALTEALRADPTNAAAIQLLEGVLSRDLEVRLARERARTRELRLTAATSLMAAARAAHDRGYPDVALRSALAAQRLAAADIPELAIFIEQLRLELATDDDQVFPLESIPLTHAAPGAKAPRVTEPEAGVLGWAADLFRTGLRRRTP